jgi:hypothetical protein
MSTVASGLSVAVGILRAMSGEVPPGLREIARCQGGIVSRRQALAAGLTPGVIVAKVRYERWQQLYRGVYATFTGPLSREARLWAAVLYAGKDARLSHETAAELHGLTARPPTAPEPPIHVTVPATRRVRQQRGLMIHVSALLGEPPRFPPGILPRTPIEATVLDLIDAARGIGEARAWIARACARGLTSEERLRAAMRARRRLRWRRALGEIVTAEAAAAHKARLSTGNSQSGVGGARDPRRNRSGNSSGSGSDSGRQQRPQDPRGIGEIGQHRVRPGGHQLRGLAGASRDADGARARG